MKTFSPPLDNGIKKAVEILCDSGIETYESCEGGPGHAYPEPTIAFHGERAEGFRALAIALQNGLPVDSLRRVWRIEDGELSARLGRLLFMNAFSWFLSKSGTFSTQAFSASARTSVLPLNIVSCVTFCVVVVNVLFYGVPR
jgi:hypothetical protein